MLGFLVVEEDKPVWFFCRDKRWKRINPAPGWLQIEGLVLQSALEQQLLPRVKLVPKFQGLSGGGGLVVSIPDFYSDDPSSNPAGYLINFLVN